MGGLWAVSVIAEILVFLWMPRILARYSIPAVIGFSLLRLSGLLPPDVDIQPLLDDAKVQLRDEADYLKEAKHLQDFRAKLGVRHVRRRREQAEGHHLLQHGTVAVRR